MIAAAEIISDVFEFSAWHRNWPIHNWKRKWFDGFYPDEPIPDLDDDKEAQDGQD